jgi:hypothetical protein
MTKPAQVFTLEPVQAAASGAPEFVDSSGAYRFFGIRKALLWRLLAEKKIRGVSIRQIGSTRGKRLFDCASIRAFLNSSADVEPEKSEALASRKEALGNRDKLGRLAGSPSAQVRSRQRGVEH